MESYIDTTTTVNPAAEQGPDMPYFRRRALAARRRPVARPTKAQKAAFAKSLMRDGRKLLSVEEMGLLAQHPFLTSSQRAEYAQLAQCAIETAVG